MGTFVGAKCVPPIVSRWAHKSSIRSYKFRLTSLLLLVLAKLPPSGASLVPTASYSGTPFGLASSSNLPSRAQPYHQQRQRQCLSRIGARRRARLLRLQSPRLLLPRLAALCSSSSRWVSLFLSARCRGCSTLLVAMSRRLSPHFFRREIYK